MTREESNRIAVELNEVLTWDRVADHMRDRNFDPFDCQLSDVMISVRKLMRTVVQVEDDEEDSEDVRICHNCGVDWRICHCPVCGSIAKDEDDQQILDMENEGG